MLFCSTWNVLPGRTVGAEKNYETYNTLFSTWDNFLKLILLFLETLSPKGKEWPHYRTTCMKQDLLSCIYNFFTFTFLINLKGVGRFFINGLVYIQPMGLWSKSQLLGNGIGHRNHLIKKSSDSVATQWLQSLKLSLRDPAMKIAQTQRSQETVSQALAQLFLTNNDSAWLGNDLICSLGKLKGDFLVTSSIPNWAKWAIASIKVPSFLVIVPWIKLILVLPGKSESSLVLKALNHRFQIGSILS